MQGSVAWGREGAVRSGAGVDGTFDAITCFNVLQHIEDDQAVLTRFADLLGPNGTVCALAPGHPLLFGRLDTAFGHERRYTSDEMRRKLRSLV